MLHPVALTYTVEKASKDRFEEIAARAGMTRAMFFEAVVDHLELNDQGVPPWVTPPTEEDTLIEGL